MYLSGLLQAIAGLAHADVEHQLGHADFPHGVGGLLVVLRGRRQAKCKLSGKIRGWAHSGKPGGHKASQAGRPGADSSKKTARGLPPSCLTTGDAQSPEDWARDRCRSPLHAKTCSGWPVGRMRLVASWALLAALLVSQHSRRHSSFSRVQRFATPLACLALIAAPFSRARFGCTRLAALASLTALQCRLQCAPLRLRASSCWPALRAGPFCNSNGER